ncbi:MAG TPA: energy-coupling factor transporter ATPase [Ruminococcaceae bacterium]|nr:energy-coupling factor transporter ATPase [Oscillospiraceae bacterium]
MEFENIVEFNNVSFRYESAEDEQQLPLAVDGVNLKIKKGECVAILGHNGSGKSTLAKLSNSILIPTEGEVIVDGMNTADEEKSYDIRKTVGVVFQNPDNQIVASIVEEDVAFGPENLGLPREEIRKRVDDSLKAVGMYEHRFSEPHKLSGGQKQRVAIAGIIAMLPKCIFFDEPTAMLDPQGRKEVIKTIFKLNREHGITTVYITHFMEEAVLADRVIVMDNAKVLLDGAPKEVFKNSQLLKDIGLDVPQVSYLSSRLKESGVDIDENILTNGEFVNSILEIIGDK